LYALLRLVNEYNTHYKKQVSSKAEALDKEIAKELSTAFDLASHVVANLDLIWDIVFHAGIASLEWVDMGKKLDLQFLAEKAEVI
jgi:hypothetical protein